MKTQQILQNWIESGKMRETEDQFSEEKRIYLNETAIENIYVSLLQFI